MNWVKLFDEDISFNVQTKVLPTKGNLVYEYNPLRNYRLSKNTYEYKGNLYSLGELYDQFGITLNYQGEINRQETNGIGVYSYIENGNNNIEQFGQWISKAYKNKLYKEINNIELLLQNNKDKFMTWKGVDELNSDPILHEAGELTDFVTNELKIDLEHPLHIVPQRSYDGSVNLIINDGINIPKLINTRFSATGRNTYEIVDRKGNNDTNIYDQGEQFSTDVSLYKRVNKIPKIEFINTKFGGNLPVGNYHFYFKLSDTDGNETDFVGESGLVSVFIGSHTYSSVNTGQKNQNSSKQVIFKLSNLDSAYDNIVVYYSRSTAEAAFNSVTEYIKVDKKFLIQNQTECKIIITGFEDVIPVSITDINLQYNVVDAAKTSAVCQNMLFLGNVHNCDIPYEELADLSLRFLPYLKEESYTAKINENYQLQSTNTGYIDPKFIYEKTGYWGEELYRLGIVYILPNGQLTPVFNIRGCVDLKIYNSDNDIYTKYPLYNEDGKRNLINYNESTYYILASRIKNDKGEYEESKGIGKHENVKGVISLAPDNDTDIINSLDIHVDDGTIYELSKHVKGYFFVRQARIPSILAQGITIGIDKESRTPSLPVSTAFLQNSYDDLEKSYVDVDDLKDVNYLSEGFISRYKFKFEEDNKLSKTDKIALVAVGVVALVAATVFTAGAAGALAGALAPVIAGSASLAGAATTATAAGVTAVLGSAAVGYTAVAAAVTVAGSALVEWTNNKQNQQQNKEKLKLNGIYTKPPEGYKIVEEKNSRKLQDNFYSRLIIEPSSANMIQGIICPDYTINQAYYNSIFTGAEHIIKTTKTQNVNYKNELSSNYFNINDRHFYVSQYEDVTFNKQGTFKIIGVPENVKAVGLTDYVFRSRAGEAEEAWRFEKVGKVYDNEGEEFNIKKNNSDIVRGVFSPYIAFDDKNNIFDPAETVNIYIPGYQANQLEDYISIRMNDNSQYYAISDRIALDDINNYLVNKSKQLGLNVDTSCGYQFNVYRGDCYICQFTQRINRNFNDPSAPYNDQIVDADSWRDYYNPDNTEDYSNINLGDVNAIPMGMWLTFRVRSSNNLNIRTLDGSNVSEAAASGHERGYFPYYPMSVEGSYKISDSQVYNRGFAKSLSERWNAQTPDVPYIKNWFGTRIMYSDIHINDAFKNGFRVFQCTNYRDYTREYGEIVKLVPLESKLLVVFEHGIGVAPVNERAVAGQGAGGKVYINTSNVLPENLMIISDMFGSQWAESVLKVPGKTGSSAQYIYGVDTVAKKIWRTDGQRLDCISDMRVQEFLNNNITLGERELTPKIGIRNVKTVYNAFKRDVLFTFYDNTYGFEEKVWNLCWNELLEKFITFYSWVPSYMENINNIPFSFDRNVSKWIAKLGTSHTESSIADGITLSNVLTNNKTKETDSKFLAVDDFTFNFTYINKEGNEVTKTYIVDESSRNNYIGVLSLSNRILPDTQLFYYIDYTLERDNYLNFENFDIVPINVQGENGQFNWNTGKLDEDGNPIFELQEQCITLPIDAMFTGQVIPVFALKFKEYKTDTIEEDPEYQEVYYLTEDQDSNTFQFVLDSEDKNIYTKLTIYKVESLLTELYYRNSAGHVYADYDYHKIGPEYLTSYASTKRIWLRDEIVLEKVIKTFGSDSKIKIGNSVASTSADGKYYVTYADGQEVRLTTVTGDYKDSGINANYPYEIFDTEEQLNEFINTHPGLNIKSEDVEIIQDKFIYWYGDLWENEYMQAQPKSTPYPCTKISEIKSLIKYRTVNGEQVPYVHGIPLAYHWTVPEEGATVTQKVYYDLPIFKDITGKRKMLEKDKQLNPDKIVTLLNIRANINILDDVNANKASNDYYNLKAGFASGTSLVDGGYYESVVAITPKWNMQFLGSDFWKHSQAGIIDITDDIKPTNWYGKQHPFEFECIVVNDPSVHKIFTNLELVANKAKPESFHYEVIGEAYDFAKDKVNMYFRQEAMKALWQYNGADICYNRNFLKIQPNQQVKSADFPHNYYTRWDTINEIEDYYISITLPADSKYDYKHLSGAEIVYYPTRQEYRVWQHSPAVDLNDLSQDDSRSVIKANCQYLEDRWKITINPILVCYKNEGNYSNGTFTTNWTDVNRPKLPVMNSPIPNRAFENIKDKQGQVNIPPVLSDLGYTANDMDLTSWLKDVNIYGTSFGEAQNRREVDVRDKFMKVRIRYSGDELAIIDFLNTIYRVSYA